MSFWGTDPEVSVGGAECRYFGCSCPFLHGVAVRHGWHRSGSTERRSPVPPVLAHAPQVRSAEGAFGPSSVNPGVVVDIAERKQPPSPRRLTGTPSDTTAPLRPVDPRSTTAPDDLADGAAGSGTTAPCERSSSPDRPRASVTGRATRAAVAPCACATRAWRAEGCKWRRPTLPGNADRRTGQSDSPTGLPVVSK